MAGEGLGRGVMEGQCAHTRRTVTCPKVSVEVGAVKSCFLIFGQVPGSARRLGHAVLSCSATLKDRYCYYHFVGEAMGPESSG